MYNAGVRICVIDFLFLRSFKCFHYLGFRNVKFQSGYCMFTKRAPETESCPLNFKQYWLITLINKFKE